MIQKNILFIFNLRIIKNSSILCHSQNIFRLCRIQKKKSNTWAHTSNFYLSPMKKNRFFSLFLFISLNLHYSKRKKISWYPNYNRAQYVCTTKKKQKKEVSSTIKTNERKTTKGTRYTQDTTSTRQKKIYVLLENKQFGCHTIK